MRHSFLPWMDKEEQFFCERSGCHSCRGGGSLPASPQPLTEVLYGHM